MNFLSRSERYDAAVRKSAQMILKLREYGISDPEEIYSYKRYAYLSWFKKLSFGYDIYGRVNYSGWLGHILPLRYLGKCVSISLKSPYMEYVYKIENIWVVKFI